MMQKEKLKTLAVGLSALTISFLVPLSASATNAGGSTTQKYDYNLGTITEGQVTITEALCGRDCQGHTITGSATASNKTIQVASGTHTITMDGPVAIDAKGDAPAFQICDGANVTLILNDNSETNLTSLSGAGLQVDEGAALTIRGIGKLEAQGGSSCAGIGGPSRNGCGDITILDGEIIARGGESGAGIGTGRDGTCGDITIAGGNITAIGGNGADYADVGAYIEGGPGIGHGDSSYGGNGGNIIVSGGTITAIGGTNAGASQSSGFNCDSLTSNGGSAKISTNSLVDVKAMNGFNAVIWTVTKEGENPTVGTVYGNATLNEGLINKRLELRPNSTLTIIKDITIDKDSRIIGDSTNSIINADKLNDLGYITPTINQKVSLAERDLIIADNLIYSGKNVNLTKDAIKINTPRTVGRKSYPVDTTNWNFDNPEILLGGKDEKMISKAGTYSVTYKYTNPENGKIEEDKTFTIRDVKVAQRDLKECRMEPINNVIYDGTKKEPVVSLSFNNEPLTLEEDFYVKYDNNINAGNDAIVIITANENGNFIVNNDPPEIERNFTINRASIADAVISIDSTSAEYDGNSHEPKISVELSDGTELKEGQDYTITPSTEDHVSAGTVTYTIEGAGNYTGTARPTEYEITKKKIDINLNKPITAKDREYDGTAAVTLEGIEFTGILDADKDDVELKSKGLVASPNIGKYDKFTFEEIELGGKKGGNYYVDISTETEYPLAKEVEIRKKVPKEADVTCTHSVSPTDGTKFLATVEVPLDKGVDYLFAMDSRDNMTAGGTIVETEDGDKVVQFTYDGIEPGSTHTFYVRSEATDNVEGVEIGSVDKEFSKLPRDEKDKPGAFTLTFAPNPADPTQFIATIPPVEGAEYSFDGENFSSVNTKTDCAPLTEYTGYIRYAATAVLQAGEIVSDTRETPGAEETSTLMTNLQRIDPNAPDQSLVPAGLKNSPDLNTMEAIIAKLTSTLSAIPGYTYERMAFYDLTIYVQEVTADGTVNQRPAQAEDFQNGGLTITINPPEGTSVSANDFVVGHMFGETMGSNLAGEIETPAVSKSANGLTFQVNGTSPIAIAWKEAATNTPDDGNGGNGDGNGGDGSGGDGTNGDGTGTGNGGDDNSNGITATADNNNPNGNGNGANGDGSTGSGTDADGETSITDAIKEAIASLAPKTGDTNKIIMWIVIAVACIAVIVGVKLKGKKGKNSSKGAKNNTTTNAAKSTNTGSSKASTTAKKTGTAKSSTTTKKTGTAKTTKTTGTTKSNKK